MAFFNGVRASWSWLCNLVRPEDTKVSASTSVEYTDNPWHELFKLIRLIDPFDYPNSPIVRCQKFSDSVQNNFEYLWHSRQYNDAGWLVLAALDKLMNEKLHLQKQIRNLKVSQCVMSENLLSFSRKAEIAETQTQSLIIRLAELQRKFNAQPRRVSEAKVRALVGKEWDPMNWDGDVWADSEESEYTEFLDANEVILPEGEISPPEMAEGSPPPPAAVLESPSILGEANAMLTKQDYAAAPQDPPLTPVFASRPITRLKAQKAPKGEIHTVTHEEVRYTPKELLEFSNSYRQRPDEQAWDWILWVWDNGGKNIHLDQAEFVDMGQLGRDSEFNVIARGVKKGINSLFGWLAEIWIKRWPTVNELEMPDIPWFTIDEGIQRLREMGMLEWICQVKPNPPHGDDPENIPFTSTLRNRFVRGAPASL
ncbi:Friend virus susceptibility protein 1-like [Cavia porcellus]|uniref:Friend virus susceptibility protein 1-like n=1 Tax=Cavia porcellus TaxID=10141 RepID=UPI002FDFFE0C